MNAPDMYRAAGAAAVRYGACTLPAMEQRVASPEQLVGSLQRLLEVPTGDLRTTFVQATDLIAETLRADKVDAFLYDATRDSLVAVSSSNQPLSALERKLGLEVLPISNGGRIVWVYKTGQTLWTGHLTEDPEELRGIKEGLRIESKVGVPLTMGGVRRGTVMIASLKRDYFTEEDARYAEVMIGWIGVLAHRAELAETTRRNAIEQSRRELAEELVATVAHDIRNYLTPIALRVHTLKGWAARERHEEPLRELEATSKSVATLRSLVSDLLDVARLEYGVFRVDPAPLELPALVEDSARGLARPGVRVDVRVQSTGTIVVLADAARLRQCVDNLIANAIEQSPEGGTVTVLINTRTRPEGEHANVEIIDEGPGVAPELLPRIFDRLATGKERRGLGLGLYLAKRIAVLHGGELTVQSTAGQGARFTLTLPCRLSKPADGC